MRSTMGVWLIALVFVLLLCATAPLEAAVYVCYPTISSGPKTGKTLQEAQKAALAVWVKKTTDMHGEQYTAWRIARDKVLRCHPGPTGEQVCEACGQPCGVQQVPPLGMAPLPRISPIKPQAAPIGCPPLNGIQA